MVLEVGYHGRIWEANGDDRVSPGSGLNDAAVREVQTICCEGEGRRW